MNPLAAAAAAVRVLASQRLDRGRLREVQNLKLRRIVEHAYRTVPYYKRLFDETGIGTSDIRTVDDLVHLPVTNKAILQRQDPEAIMSRSFDRSQLVEARTSGSTGRPFTFLLDRQFVRVRDATFLRALTAVGYRPGRKLLVITADTDKPRRPWLPWRYASLTDPPEKTAALLREMRPWAVYGPPSGLKQLAIAANDMGDVLPVSTVISRGEVLDPVSRRALGEAFGGEVYDFYGLTEMGMVAWECRERDGYHVSEDVVVVEEHQDLGSHGEAPLLMTNLVLRSMPLIRFDAGDLAVTGATTTCRCGRTLRRLDHIEGRTVDCIRVPGGGTISPYHVTLALLRVAGLLRYQVVQDGWSSFTVRLESETAAVDATIREAMRDIVGPDADVQIERTASLDPLPGRKFRVVQCDLPPSDNGS